MKSSNQICWHIEDELQSFLDLQVDDWVQYHYVWFKMREPVELEIGDNTRLQVFSQIWDKFYW